MEKIILVPDSFKGTMSSNEVCDIMHQAILRHFSDAKVVSIPVADGGEGSVDCFLAALGGEKVEVMVKGPYSEDMLSFYGRLPDGTAVIEMAACAGLPLVEGRKAAEKTTTYGVGLLIKAAVKDGCRKIIVGLGGSATNDGGTGMAAALGVKFFDGNGRDFIPVGETLHLIQRINVDSRIPELKGVDIVTMCDIDNPLCGLNGAAHIFGPQKGATPEIVEMLDNGLLHLAAIISRDLGKDVLTLPGAGAAGGMGGGMVAFLDSKLQMGIETVLDITGFDEHLKGADLVLSGEGKLDRQSLRGKVVIGVARRTQKLDVPLVAIVGDIGDDIEEAYNLGVSAIFSINRMAIPFSESRIRSKDDLRLTVDNLIRWYKTTRRCDSKH